jgi:hypothetical protein
MPGRLPDLPDVDAAGVDSKRCGPSPTHLPSLGDAWSAGSDLESLLQPSSEDVTQPAETRMDEEPRRPLKSSAIIELLTMHAQSDA